MLTLGNDNVKCSLLFVVCTIYKQARLTLRQPTLSSTLTFFVGSLQYNLLMVSVELSSSDCHRKPNVTSERFILTQI